MFLEKPGARERHLKRKFNNPLFAGSSVDELDIQQARKQDAEEIEQFMNYFRELVEQAVSLDGNTEADVILKLKEQMDKCYEQCSGLAGDMGEIREMIVRLLESIMQAMWKAIGQDLQAQSKLENEEKARASHFQMLKYSLVADLLRPDTPIKEDELVAVFLSDSEENVKMAIQLFAPEQQAVIYQQARELIEKVEQTGDVPAMSRARLADMEAAMTAINDSVN